MTTRIPGFLRTLSALFALCLCSQLGAQTKTIYTFTTPTQNVYGLKQTGNKVVLLAYNQNVRIDPAAGTYTSLVKPDLFSDYPGSLRESDNGLFYCINHNGGVRIRYLSSDSNFISKPLTTTPADNPIALVLDNKYYVVVPFGGGSAIWESDGTEAGTNAIVNSAEPIVGLTRLGKKIVYCCKSGNNYKVFKHNVSGNPIFFQTLSGKPTFYNTDDSLHLFYTKSDTASTWFSDGVTAVKIDANQFNGYIKSNGSNFYLIGSLYAADYYQSVWKGSFTQGALLQELKFSDSLVLVAPVFYSDQFILCNSILTGYEPGRINYVSDSLEMIRDLYKGPGSSCFYSIVGDNTVNTRSVFIYNGDLYFIGTNGMNNSQYLYRTEGNGLRSLFRLNSSREILKLYINSGKVYWLTYETATRTCSLQCRDLQETDPAQPSSLSNSEEWNRQVNVLRPNAGGSGTSMKGLSSTTDKDGNLVANFDLESPNGWAIAFSDTTATYPPKANNCFVKYDKYGRFQWCNILGQGRGYGIFPNTRFCLDTAGDVIACGVFATTGIFDGDTISAPGANYYIAKLSGKNGNVLWKKIISKRNYTNDLFIDALTCDDKNNIYLSLMYFDFFCSIQGANVTVTSTVSPMNAMCKFRDGNLVWIKNTQTPWTNTYGRTHTMVYDPVSKSIVTTQSQGYYNTMSPCKYQSFGNYIQKMDTAGNLRAATQIVGDDLGGISAAVVSDGKILCNGYYRGALIAGAYTLATSPGNGCNVDENFRVIYDPESSTIERVFGSEANVFYPYSAATDKENIYVIGAGVVNNHAVLMIKKYDRKGKLLARRVFDQMVSFSAFDFDWFYSISVTTNHILITGENKSGGFDTLRSHLLGFDDFQGFTIWKFGKNEGWIPESEVEKISFIETDEDVLVYPVPTERYLNLQLKHPEEYNLVEIYNLTGEKVIEVKTGNEYFQSIDLSDLPVSVYVLKVTGEKSFVRKIMRH